MIKNGDVFEFNRCAYIWIKNNDYKWQLFSEIGEIKDVDWFFHHDSERLGNRVMNIFTKEIYNG